MGSAPGKPMTPKTNGDHSRIALTEPARPDQGDPATAARGRGRLIRVSPQLVNTIRAANHRPATHHFSTLVLSSTAPLRWTAPMTLRRQSSTAAQLASGAAIGGGAKIRGLPVSAGAGRPSGKGNPSAAVTLSETLCAIAGAATAISITTASITAAPIVAPYRIAG